MTKRRTLNIKLYNSQLNKLKPGIKNGTEAHLNLLSNGIGNSNDDEINFLHKLLLTDMQVSRFCQVFGNGSSANIKLSKTQLSKMVQLGGFIENFLKSMDAIAKLGGEVWANLAPNKSSFRCKT